MCKIILPICCLLLICCLAHPSHGDMIILDDFESGTLAAWNVTGNAWTVGGAAGSSPTISPFEGGFFARSGAPNSGGALDETNTGIMTSPVFHVTHDTLEWHAVGWSGQFGNGLNHFQILDSSFDELARVDAPLSDSWTLQSIDLMILGLNPGDDFYFRATDGNDSGGFAWIGVDNLAFNGNAIPEPSTYALFSALIVTLTLLRRKCNT